MPLASDARDFYFKFLIHVLTPKQLLLRSELIIINYQL